MGLNLSKNPIPSQQLPPTESPSKTTDTFPSETQPGIGSIRRRGDSDRNNKQKISEEAIMYAMMMAK